VLYAPEMHEPLADHCLDARARFPIVDSLDNA
jgi:hypothetical protein